MKINIPAASPFFGSADAAIVDATGSIMISATQLELSGEVTLLGGLLGQGNATLDINWTTGVYTVSGGFSVYDGIIGFNGRLTITNRGHHASRHCQSNGNRRHRHAHVHRNGRISARGGA
jgi:hypothetical protein